MPRTLLVGILLSKRTGLSVTEAVDGFTKRGLRTGAKRSGTMAAISPHPHRTAVDVWKDFSR